MTAQQYFKKYKNAAKIISFLEEKDYADKDLPSYEWDSLKDWYLKTRQYLAKKYTKEKIIPEIKEARKEKSGRYYIVFDGLNGYQYMTFCRGLGFCRNRGGCSSPAFCTPGTKFKLQDVIADSLFEYESATNEDFTTLKVSAMTEDELLESGIFPFLKKPVKATVINVPSSFWEKIGWV